MREMKKKQLLRGALLVCLTAIIAVVLATSCFAEGFMGFGRRRMGRTAETSDVPPIADGIESGAESIVDGVESGANDIIDGVESSANGIVDGVESGIDRVESDMGMDMETNVPDTNIGGAVKDEDHDGLPDTSDSDDDGDGTPDVLETTEMADTDKKSAVIGIVIAGLVVAALVALIFALMPKKKK